MAQRMHEPQAGSRAYKGGERRSGAQWMAHGSHSASLAAVAQLDGVRCESAAPLGLPPFADGEVATSRALLPGRHWVDNRA